MSMYDTTLACKHDNISSLTMNLWLCLLCIGRGIREYFGTCILFWQTLQIVVWQCTLAVVCMLLVMCEVQQAAAMATLSPVVRVGVGCLLLHEQHPGCVLVGR
jgi:hypothetical protein